MPDINGLLSENDKEKVRAWVVEKWKNGRCLRCGEANYELGHHIVYPPRLGKRGYAGGTVYPHVLITCLVCGSVYPISALLIGLNLDEIGLPNPGEAPHG